MSNSPLITFSLFAYNQERFLHWGICPFIRSGRNFYYALRDRGFYFQQKFFC